MFWQTELRIDGDTMKQIWIYVIVSTISFLLLFQIAIIAAIVFPDVYAPFRDKVNSAGAIDPSGELAGGDSIHPAEADTASAEIHMEGGSAQLWQDSITALRRTIEVLEDSLHVTMNELNRERRHVSTLRAEIDRLTSTLEGRLSNETRELARMIETMPAEDAVRILRITTDKEARDVLLKINRRQAARIMSMLDPERAARIMQLTVESHDTE